VLDSNNGVIILSVAVRRFIPESIEWFLEDKFIVQYSVADPGCLSRILIFYPKIVTMLSKILVWDAGSEIRKKVYSGSWIQGSKRH
jgi:hypothetical protein